MLLATGYKTITCCQCDCMFAVPADVKQRWVDRHTSFYCPYCKTSQSYGTESDKEKYKRLYEQKDRCCENLQEVVQLRERQIAGHKEAQGLLRNQRDEAREKAVG